MNNIYKISKFVSIFKKGQIYALYHSIFNNKIYLNTFGYKLFMKFKKPISSKRVIEQVCRNKWKKNKVVNTIKELIKKKFIIIEEKYDENKLFDEFRNYYSKKEPIDISLAYILLTVDCNLRCKYCFIENTINNIQRQTFLKIEDIKQFINLFIKHINKFLSNKKFIFYGGEPLLQKNLFKNAVLYIREIESQGAFYTSNVSISLLTNGILLDQDLINFIKENKISIGISIDGMAKSNDKMRIDISGKGTFKKVVNNIKLLVDNNIDFGISLTVGKHNVNNLKENVKLLIKIGSPNIKSVNFNLIHSYKKEKNPAYANIDKVINEIIEVSKYLIGRGIYEDRVWRRWKYFINKNLYLKDCAGYGNQIVLSPFNTIGPCHAFVGSQKYFIKYNTNIDLYKHPIWRKWRNRIALNMKKCIEKECKYIGYCGGGCAHEAYIKFGDLYEVDDNICKLTEKLIELYIWKFYDDNKEKNKQIKKI